jgi:hypothetical protein
MRTITEEFNVPLDKVSRAWIRRPAFIALLPLFILVFIVGAIGYFVESVIELFTEIW